MNILCTKIVPRYNRVDNLCAILRKSTKQFHVMFWVNWQKNNVLLPSQPLSLTLIFSLCCRTLNFSFFLKCCFYVVQHFYFQEKKMLFSCCINFFLNFFFDTTFEFLTNITIPWVSTALNCWIIIRPSNRILIEINEDF